MTTSSFLQHLVRHLWQTADTRPAASLSDADLLQCFQQHGDPHAVEAIVRRYGNCVLSACRKVLPTEADVEDAFQATFVVLLQHGNSIRHGQSLGGWLSCVAHRVALKALTNAVRRQRVEQRQRPAASEAPDLSWREACAILHEELDKLPDQYRRPLILCYLDGKSRDEAAQQLGLTTDALRGRLNRGRERLRGRLLKRGIALSVGLLAVATKSATATALSEPLLRATLETAIGSRIPASVAALIHGATPSLIAGKFKLLAIAVLGIGLISGAGLWLFGAAPTAQPPQGAPPRTQRTAAADTVAQPREEKKPSEPAQDEKKETVEVSGSVLLPDGKPCAGAKLFVPRLKKANPQVPEDVSVEQIGTTGEDGKFRVTFQYPKGLYRSYLIAHAEGYAVDFLELKDQARADNVTLKLVKDQPITGRIVDTEGKPLAGISVGIGGVYVPAGEKLDDYLTGWKKNWRDTASTPDKRLYLPLDGITGLVTTDKDGRFKLTGAGVERIVQLSIHGSGLARSTPYVITRPGFDPKPYNDAALNKEPAQFRIKGQVPILYAPDFVFVAESSKVVEGVVKDAVTGKALAGISLHAHFGFGDGVSAKTDKDGKYRLEGLPSDKEYHIYANPPDGSAYLRRGASVPDMPGNKPLRMDIEMVKGVFVSGRIIDKQTGKGVPGGIRFAPLPKNTYFEKPGFDGYKRDRTMQTVDADGRFRVVTIPGPSLLMIQAHGREKANGAEVSPYTRAIPDPDYKDLFRYEKDDDTWLFTSAGGGLEFLSTENVVKVVDLKENGDEVKIELTLERGKTATIALQDTDGKPLAGVVASGVTAHWPITFKLNEATATVFALDPDKPRRLVFLHPEKKLGGTAVVRGDEKEPVVVKLAPLGTVTGRFVDTDGVPLAGAVLGVSCPDRIASELYRQLALTAPIVKTDKDGRFTLPDIVPEVKFYIQPHKGNTYYVGEPRIGLKEVAPGKTLDLGEHKLKPQ